MAGAGQAARIASVNALLGDVARRHSDEHGHETFLMRGAGWMCTTCEHDHAEVLAEFMAEERDEHVVVRYAPRDLYTFSGHFRAASPEEAEAAFVAMLAQLEDVDGGTLRGHRHPAGGDDYSTVFPAGGVADDGGPL